ncbi:MAG TPA: S1C family serine protease [Candidatus Acidoferrum sp.]|nr:S1C family serine protease [Candidatus Acidoferrum sp.]
MLWIVVALAVFFSIPAAASEVPLSSLENGMNDLVYSLSRSIVTVVSTRSMMVPSVFGGSEEALQNLVSSGVIYDSGGAIVVAAATVVGADHIYIDFDDQQIPARLVAVDYNLDLALLQAQHRVGRPVQYSDRQLCAGQMVIAMGNAYGLRAAPTIGFCAGMRDDGTLQFTAPVTSGAVGGGVFDLNGRLLGVVIGTIGQADRVALAISAYRLPGMVDYLLKNGDRQAGYIGVSTADVEISSPAIETAPSPAASVSSLGHRMSEHGVVVTYVAPASPAAQAGVRRGDVVISFDHTPLATAPDLLRLVRQSTPGSTVDLEFVRHNTFFDVKLMVGRKQYFRPMSFSETEQFDEPTLSPDSLTRILDYLKQEVSRLENRINHSR